MYPTWALPCAKAARGGRRPVSPPGGQKASLLLALGARQLAVPRRRPPCARPLPGPGLVDRAASGPPVICDELHAAAVAVGRSLLLARSPWSPRASRGGGFPAYGRQEAGEEAEGHL